MNTFLVMGIREAMLRSNACAAAESSRMVPVQVIRFREFSLFYCAKSLEKHPAQAMCRRNKCRSAQQAGW